MIRFSIAMPLGSAIGWMLGVLDDPTPTPDEHWASFLMLLAFAAVGSFLDNLKL